MLNNYSAFNSHKSSGTFLPKILLAWSSFGFGFSLTSTAALFHALSGKLTFTFLTFSFSMIPLFALLSSLSHTFFQISFFSKLSYSSLFYAISTFVLLFSFFSKYSLALSKIFAGIAIGLTSSLLPPLLSMLNFNSSILPLGIVSGTFIGALSCHFSSIEIISDKEPLWTSFKSAISLVKANFALFLPFIVFSMLSGAHSIYLYIYYKNHNESENTGGENNSDSISERNIDLGCRIEKNNNDHIPSKLQKRPLYTNSTDSSSVYMNLNSTNTGCIMSNSNQKNHFESTLTVNECTHNSNSNDIDKHNTDTLLLGHKSQSSKTQNKYRNHTNSDASQSRITCLSSQYKHDQDALIKNGICNLLINKKARKSNILLATAHITQQISFINGVIPVLDRALANYGKNRFLAASAVYLVSLLTTIVATAFKNIKQKTLLLTSCITVTVGLILLGTPISKLFSVILFMIGFNIGLGPVVWMLTTQLYPKSFSKESTVIGTCINWSANCIVVMLTGPLIERIADKTYFIFAALMIISTIIIQKYLKEKPFQFQ